MNQIHKDVYIGETVKLGENVIIHAGVIIGNNIEIKDNVEIEYGTIIYDNVIIGRNTHVGARCILGEHLAEFYTGNSENKHSLLIGDNSLIRSETIIYTENEIGAYFETGHRVTIREYSQIGEHVRIGTLSDIQGYCEIGNYVNMHSNVHIGQYSKIKDFAMIFPYVVLTNDPYPPSRPLHGVTVGSFSIISTGSVLLPGIEIGDDVLVGAGAIVTKDIETRKIAVGNPAKVVGEITTIVNKNTGKQVYPWRYSFEEGMPWMGIGYDEWKESSENFR